MNNFYKNKRQYIEGEPYPFSFTFAGHHFDCCRVSRKFFDKRNCYYMIRFRILGEYKSYEVKAHDRPGHIPTEEFILSSYNIERIKCME